MNLNPFPLSALPDHWRETFKHPLYQWFFRLSNGPEGPRWIDPAVVQFNSLFYGHPGAPHTKYGPRKFFG